MKNPFFRIPIRQAALGAGLAFIISVVIAVIVYDILLANFVPPGDAAVLDSDINTNPSRLGLAAAGYLFVLFLDCIIAFGLFVVIRPAAARLAAATFYLRILYAVLVGAGVVALTFQLIDAYSYTAIKKFGYVFFVLHLLVLGFAILKTSYLPNLVGIGLLLAASTYSVFFVDIQMPEMLNVVTMLVMAFAELSLFIWLIIYRNRIPAKKTEIFAN